MFQRSSEPTLTGLAVLREDDLDLWHCCGGFLDAWCGSRAHGGTRARKTPVLLEAAMKPHHLYSFELKQLQPQWNHSFTLQAWLLGSERPLVKVGAKCALRVAVASVRLTGATEKAVFFAQSFKRHRDFALIDRLAILYQCEVPTPDDKDDRTCNHGKRVGRNQSRRREGRARRLRPRSLHHHGEGIHLVRLVPGFAATQAHRRARDQAVDEPGAQGCLQVSQEVERIVNHARVFLPAGARLLHLAIDLAVGGLLLWHHLASVLSYHISCSVRQPQSTASVTAKSPAGRLWGAAHTGEGDRTPVLGSSSPSSERMSEPVVRVTKMRQALAFDLKGPNLRSWLLRSAALPA
ncbi:hypothetical protein V5799_015015 [Amblyomma americanum]|uniref:Uncharacterized protein n=1 Tax=Amblyomma americanum TaxID=6943 RepID=A0AAQ4E1D0_AMBAM